MIMLNDRFDSLSPGWTLYGTLSRCNDHIVWKDVHPFNFRDEFSNVVEMWNKIREEAVTVCINEFLIPVFEREVHERLLQEARDYVVKVVNIFLFKIFLSMP